MTTLPNFSKATIDRRKITGYLLARDHPTGRAKAAFFESLGFHRDSPEVLEMFLLLHAIENAVIQTIETEYGTKFIISGPIQTPIGVPAKVCVVWFVENDQVEPRLITAFPD